MHILSLEIFAEQEEFKKYTSTKQIYKLLLLWLNILYENVKC